MKDLNFNSDIEFNTIYNIIVFGQDKDFDQLLLQGPISIYLFFQKFISRLIHQGEKTFELVLSDDISLKLKKNTLIINKDLFDSISLERVKKIISQMPNLKNFFTKKEQDQLLLASFFQNNYLVKCSYNDLLEFDLCLILQSSGENFLKALTLGVDLSSNYDNKKWFDILLANTLKSSSYNILTFLKILYEENICISSQDNNIFKNFSHFLLKNSQNPTIYEIHHYFSKIIKEMKPYLILVETQDTLPFNSSTPRGKALVFTTHK